MSHVSRARWRASGALILLAGLALAPPIALPANAASSACCEGGGFVISGLNDGSTVSTDGTTTISASYLGAGFLVEATYSECTVVSASFGVHYWTRTGVPNPLDITGNLRTVLFDSKTPDDRALILT